MPCYPAWGSYRSTRSLSSKTSCVLAANVLPFFFFHSYRAGKRGFCLIPTLALNYYWRRREQVMHHSGREISANLNQQVTVQTRLHSAVEQCSYSSLSCVVKQWVYIHFISSPQHNLDWSDPWGEIWTSCRGWYHEWFSSCWRLQVASHVAPVGFVSPRQIAMNESTDWSSPNSVHGREW